jgi:hypothetical protein
MLCTVRLCVCTYCLYLTGFLAREAFGTVMWMIVSSIVSWKCPTCWDLLLQLSHQCFRRDAGRWSSASTSTTSTSSVKFREHWVSSSGRYPCSSRPRTVYWVSSPSTCSRTISSGSNGDMCTLACPGYQMKMNQNTTLEKCSNHPVPANEEQKLPTSAYNTKNSQPNVHTS